MQGDDAVRHFRAFLNALGLTPEVDSELDRTPERFTQLLIDMSQGLRTPAPDISAFDIVDAIDHEPVLLIGLPFSSLCVHHLLPFFGTIDVAYIPGPKMVGFGSIGRVIDHFAQRPQVQERLVTEIADYLQTHLQPTGLLIRCRARQLCMEMRGAQKSGDLISFAARGTLKSGELRQEIIQQFLRGQAPT